MIDPKERERQIERLKALCRKREELVLCKECLADGEACIKSLYKILLYEEADRV
jgi:hypothetical protein